MRIIRAADCRAMPWKNGGGTTTEIAIHPPGATLDDFEWRISMAHVSADGPFSTFPGIDRTLSVLNGSGIRLAFGDGETTTLDRRSEPFAFAADRAVTGLLVDGAIDDVNVMSRRGRWRHRVRRLDGDGPAELSVSSDLLVFVASAGRWTIAREVLATGDSAVLTNGEEGVFTGDRGAVGLAVDLWAETAI